jgi:predicted Zn-dependent protease
MLVSLSRQIWANRPRVFATRPTMRVTTGLAISVVLLGTVAAGFESSNLLVELQQALTKGDQQRVHSIETEVLSSKPDLDTLLTAGGLLGEHNFLQDSATVFERCVQQFPASFEAHYNLALARIALNQNREAWNALHSATPSSKAQKAALQYLEGKIEQATGHLKEAQENFEGAYQASPEQENYALDLALLYIRTAAYVPAIDVLHAAGAHHPDSPEIMLELAVANALAGRKSEALALCRKLERAGSGDSTPQLIAAFAECMSNDYRACANEAEAGLRASHPHPYLYYLHAEALWNIDSADRSAVLSDLNSAVTKLPACAVCLQLRGKLFESMHNDKAAIDDLRAVVAHDPQSAQAWYRLSILYKKAGQNREATEALRHYRAAHEEKTNQELESFRSQFMR